MYRNTILAKAKTMTMVKLLGDLPHSCTTDYSKPITAYKVGNNSYMYTAVIIKQIVPSIGNQSENN